LNPLLQALSTIQGGTVASTGANPNYRSAGQNAATYGAILASLYGVATWPCKPRFWSTIGMNAPAVGMDQERRRRSWQARLFDRLSPGVDVEDKDKRALVSQGLLQLAAGLQSSPNFGQGLTQGC
jgi:hypothetical protein